MARREDELGSRLPGAKSVDDGGGDLVGGEHQNTGGLEVGASSRRQRRVDKPGANCAKADALTRQSPGQGTDQAKV